MTVTISYELTIGHSGRRDELDSMRERLLSARRTLYDAVVNEQKVG